MPGFTLLTAKTASFCQLIQLHQEVTCIYHPGFKILPLCQKDIRQSEFFPKLCGSLNLHLYTVCQFLCYHYPVMVFPAPLSACRKHLIWNIFDYLPVLVSGGLQTVCLQKNRLLEKGQRLQNEMQKKDDRIRKLTEENEALISECELFRGKLMLLMQKVK